jgi:hypothetical protein
LLGALHFGPCPTLSGYLQSTYRFDSTPLFKSHESIGQNVENPNHTAICAMNLNTESSASLSDNARVSCLLIGF